MYDLLKDYRNLARKYKGYHQPRSQVFKLYGRHIAENVPVRKNQCQNLKNSLFRDNVSRAPP